MTRRSLARSLLVYTTPVALLEALSLPTPSLEAPGLLALQTLLFGIAVACPFAFALLKRRPRAGWRCTAGLGLVGAGLLCLQGWPYLKLVLSGRTPFWGPAIFLSLPLALIVAGCYSLGAPRLSPGGLD
jgi:hypothetical protein